MKVFKSEKGKSAVYESYDRLLEQWGINVEEADIKGKYGSTHVVMAGDPKNPPLLLFHGVGDNSALMWIYNAKGLSENYRIIAVDAIGGAGKSMPGLAYSKGFSQTEWISELMDSMGIEKADAVGVSYGCYIVQLLKMELPGRIGKIIGMAGSVSLEGSKGHALKMMMVFLPEALFPTDRNAVKLCKKLSGPDSNVIADNAELFRHWKLLLKNFNNMSISKHDTRKQFSIADYKGIRDETLLIIGKYDKFAYYPESLKILGDLGMNYEIIEDAGHVANHEFPGLINQKIIEFLTR